MSKVYETMKIKGIRYILVPEYDSHVINSDRKFPEKAIRWLVEHVSLDKNASWRRAVADIKTLWDGASEKQMMDYWGVLPVDESCDYFLKESLRTKLNALILQAQSIVLLHIGDNGAKDLRIDMYNTIRMAKEQLEALNNV